jgi:hypothetical protein
LKNLHFALQVILRKFSEKQNETMRWARVFSCVLSRALYGRLLLALMTVTFGFAGNSALAQTREVAVAGYIFPPFVNENQRTGLTIDFIELVNQEQDTFKF